MILALDVGATHIRSGLVVGKRVEERRLINTPKTKENIIRALFGLVDSYSSVSCICVGVASFISKGVTRNTNNMDFSNVDVKKLFESNLKNELVCFQEYHALVVEHAKRFYRKKENNPPCPLIKV